MKGCHFPKLISSKFLDINIAQFVPCRNKIQIHETYKDEMCFKCTYANNVSYVDSICLEKLIDNNGKNVLDDFEMQIQRKSYTSHSFIKVM